MITLTITIKELNPNHVDVSGKVICHPESELKASEVSALRSFDLEAWWADMDKIIEGIHQRNTQTKRV